MKINRSRVRMWTKNTYNAAKIFSIFGQYWNSTLAAQVNRGTDISPSSVRLPPLWVWFRKSLVDWAPWWLCHDAVGSSQQFDQAKQASGYAYNFLPPRCHVQNVGHVECRGRLCRCLSAYLGVFRGMFICICFTSSLWAETSRLYTDWQQIPCSFYHLF